MKKLVSFLLCISLAFANVPFSFAAGGWSVTYDASYPQGSLNVEIYDAENGYAPAVSWTDNGGTIYADQSSSALFSGGGDYYAVVQYEASAASGSGGGTQLSDEEIAIEYDKLLAAIHSGEDLPPITIPDGYPDETLEDAEAIYRGMCADTDFTEWLSEENGDNLQDWDTFTEEVYSWYDPQDPDYDPEEPVMEILSFVNETLSYYYEFYGAETYLSQTSYDINTKRMYVENYIANPSMAPEGYTPPGSGGSGGSGTRVVVHKLTSAEMSGGLTVGSGFFSDCVRLDISGGSPLSDVYWVSGETAVPAAITVSPDESGDEGDDYGSDMLIPGADQGPEESGRLTGSVYTGSAYYVDPGRYLVINTQSAGSSDAVIDWEEVNVTSAGGSVNFDSGRSLLTVNAGVSGLTLSNGLSGLTAGLYAGSNARVYKNITLAGTDSYGNQTVKALKVKPGSYDNIEFTVTKAPDMSTTVSYNWSKELSGISSNMSLTLPSPDTPASSYTKELRVVRPSDESTGPFEPGDELLAEMVISSGDYKLTYISAMKIDMAALQAAMASGGDIPSDAYSVAMMDLTADLDGIAVSGAAYPVFALTAPDSSKMLNAAASIKLQDVIDMTFTSSAAVEIEGSAVDEPPAVPSGFEALAADGSVNFSWTANTEDDLAGYRIYRVDAASGGETLAASPGKTANSASVSIDYAGWGSAPWYFGIKAVDEAGNSSAISSSVTVSDPRVRFSGKGSFEAASGRIEENRFYISDVGAIAFSFAPAQTVAEGDKPDTVDILVKYKDMGGKAKESTVSLAKTADYTASWAIPDDAAVLVTAAFSFDLEGSTVVLDTVDLGSLSVYENVTVTFPQSYELAEDFESVTMFAGEMITLTKGSSGFTGTVPRSGCGAASLYIQLNGSTYNVSSISSYMSTGVFSIPSEALPKLLRLDLTLTEGADLSEIYAELEGDADGDLLTFVPKSGGRTGDAYRWYFLTGEEALSYAHFNILLEDYSLNLKFAADEGAQFLEEIEIIPGAVYQMSGRLTTALDQYMYLNVLGGKNQNIPVSGYMDLEFTDTQGNTSKCEWNSLGVVDTSLLTEGETYTVGLGSAYSCFDSEPLTVTAVKDGSNKGSAPSLRLIEFAQIEFSALFETDMAGIPGSQTAGAQKIVPEEYDVYYRSAQSGEWVLINGLRGYEYDRNAGNERGASVHFTSDPVRRDMIDTTAGLKIVFGNAARPTNVYVQGIGNSAGYHTTFGDPVTLKSGQEFYTVSSQGTNTLTTAGLNSYTKDTSGNGQLSGTYLYEYSLQLYVGGYDKYGSKAAALVSGLAVADSPRAELNVNRNVEEQAAIFVLRNSEGQSYRFGGWITGIGVLSVSFTGLPYGTYDMLMYTGPSQDQLENQFMDGDLSTLPPGVCGTVITGRTLSESGACIKTDLPPAPASADIKGIQSISVAADKEMALPGDRVSFTVHFSAAPGGSEADRTLNIGSLDRFDPDGASASLVLEDGSRVQPVSLSTSMLVVPESSQMMSGTLVITGKANSKTDSSHARIKASVGNTDGSWDYTAGRCWIVDFNAVCGSKTHTPSTWIQGRAASGSSLTVRMTSKADPSVTAEQAVTVPQYGYWKAALTLPLTDPKESEDFGVEVLNAGGAKLWPADGEEKIISYIADDVLPSNIKLTYSFNGSRIDLSCEPGSAKDFADLNKAIITFGADYETTGVMVQITFDDSNPDEWGLTDARRVMLPSLALRYSKRLDPIYIEFYPVDSLTYSYNNTDLDISISEMPYSTSYYTVFPATRFGTMSICYDLMPCRADLDIGTETEKAEFRDFMLNTLGNSVPEANSAADGLRDMADYTNARGGKISASRSADFSTGNISFEPFRKSEFQELEEDEEDAAVIGPVSGTFDATATVTFSNEMITQSTAAQIIAERSTRDPAFSKEMNGSGSFVKYMDSDVYLTFTENADGKIDMNIVSSMSLFLDMSQVPDSITASGASPLRTRSASLMTAGPGDSTAPAPVQMTDMEILTTIKDFAQDATFELLDDATSEGGEIFAKIPAGAERIKAVQGISSNAVGALNMAKNTYDAATTMTDNMDKIADKAKEYIKQLDRYQETLEKSMTCYKEESHRFDAIMKIMEIKYEGQDKIREIQRDGGKTQLAIALCATIPNAAVMFVPVPGTSTAMGVITGLWAKQAIQDQEFYDTKDFEQAFQEYENKMYQALKSTYTSKPCEPEKDTNDYVNIVHGEWGDMNYSLEGWTFGRVDLDPTSIVDPSGVVYEALLSNPLEGVEVSIEYKDVNGNWQLWAAAPDYNDQQASYVTNASGFYKWDVPDGTWRVKYYKEGYNSGAAIYSDEMPVPPIWLDVNQNMVSSEAASAEAKADKNGVTVGFTRPVMAEDVSAAAITAEDPASGSAVTGPVIQLLKDGEPVDVPVTIGTVENGLVRSITMKPEIDRTGSYTVKISGIRTYAGTESSFEIPVDLSGLDNVEKVIASLSTGEAASDGQTLPYGSRLVLTAPTEGSVIYYTTNGVCPKDDAENRVLYSGPITLTEGTYFFRIRAFKDGVWSGGLPLHLTVTTYAGADDEEPAAAPETTPAAIEMPFTDVPGEAYFHDAVEWAYANGITDGTSADKFSPYADCSRGQVVTFLWRAAGCPEPEAAGSAEPGSGITPFTDVPAGIYYEKAVAWAYENGITDGTSAGHFSPEKTCTRAQVVTFLWRYEGYLKTAGEAQFSDVPTDAYYYDAVLWARDTGVTDGTSASRFSPEQNCTRAQIVTFLYRDMVK